MADYVPDDQRDEVIKRLLQQPENKVSLIQVYKFIQVFPYLINVYINDKFNIYFLQFRYVLTAAARTQSGQVPT